MWLQVNYMGCLHVAKCLLPGMLRRGRGHLCFIASAVVISPMAGYTAYAASKAAVRALADGLRSETQSTGVTVSIGYPPDTQTPGFDKENESKAAVTAAIADAFHDTVYSATTVAASLFQGLQRGAYHLPTPDTLAQLGLSLIAGVTPRPLPLLLELLLAPVLVVIAAVYRGMQDGVVRKFNARAPPAA